MELLQRVRLIGIVNSITTYNIIIYVNRLIIDKKSVTVVYQLALTSCIIFCEDEEKDVAVPLPGVTRPELLIG